MVVRCLRHLQPAPTLVRSIEKPDGKHGSEVTSRSVMTSATAAISFRSLLARNLGPQVLAEGSLSLMARAKKQRVFQPSRIARTRLRPLLGDMEPLKSPPILNYMP